MKVEKIKVDELEQIFKSLTDRLRLTTGGEIELSVDYYWHIPSDQIYNPYEDPKNLDMGQLWDDLAELRRILREEDDAIFYDFERLGNILIAVSNELTKKDIVF